MCMPQHTGIVKWHIYSILNILHTANELTTLIVKISVYLFHLLNIYEQKSRYD